MIFPLAPIFFVDSVAKSMNVTVDTARNILIALNIFYLPGFLLYLRGKITKKWPKSDYIAFMMLGSIIWYIIMAVVTLLDLSQIIPPY